MAVRENLERCYLIHRHQWSTGTWYSPVKRGSHKYCLQEKIKQGQRDPENWFVWSFEEYYKKRLYGNNKWGEVVV